MGRIDYKYAGPDESSDCSKGRIYLILILKLKFYSTRVIVINKMSGAALTVILRAPEQLISVGKICKIMLTRACPETYCTTCTIKSCCLANYARFDFRSVGDR